MILPSLLFPTVRGDSGFDPQMLVEMFMDLIEEIDRFFCGRLNSGILKPLKPENVLAN